MYQLEFLPIARQDMADIVRYISHELFNQAAAENLADEMIDAAERLADFPYINAIHQSIRPLKKEYRKLIVKNYIMFYWIDEKEKRVTIARVIYARRDYERLLSGY
jgi:addiction module RelE/StbE family toxin